MNLTTRLQKHEIKASTEPVLIVDLDGTLIKTDLLFEGLLILLRKNLLYIFPCFLWLLKGRAVLKRRILEQVHLPIELLPFNKNVLTFLQEEFLRGRRLILATASPLEIATKISEIYPIFEKVYGTYGNINLKGKSKLNLILKEFGAGNYDYIGNSHADLRIFSSANASFLVNPSIGLQRRAKKITSLSNLDIDNNSKFKIYLKSIRIHQWVKNLLVFIPIITSHTFFSTNVILMTLVGFFAFSFVSSSGYIINDLFDLNSDRKHPSKKLRPFASGQITIVGGIFLACSLFLAGIFLTFFLNTSFLLLLLLYFIITLSYSLFFKRKALLDVFILAILYSLRIIAGGIITSIPLSSWLILFSAFMFLSLAFVKRYSELILITDKSGLKNRGREYFMEDILLLQIMGIASGFISVVIFSLYIDSPDVMILYQHPKILWGISLLLLFWVSRVWMITNRGQMNEDPIIFAIKDRTSHWVCLIAGLLIYLSI
jgi:4-hydroxybenzoate polyprenyltransferase/phosphoserine phosphatase